MIIDLGCGKNKRGNFGIDLVGPPLTSADIVCNLGFEAIPFADSIADRVVAFDFMEHVPFCVWGESGRRLMPVIFLLNEIWRVLKPGGEFEMRSPVYPSIEAFRDPTHVSFWTMQTAHYLTGDLGNDLAASYGILAKYRLLVNEMDGSHLRLVLQAVKGDAGWPDARQPKPELEPQLDVLADEQERRIWALGQHTRFLERAICDKDEAIGGLERSLAETRQYFEGAISDKDEVIGGLERSLAETRQYFEGAISDKDQVIRDLECSLAKLRNLPATRIYLRGVSLLSELTARR